MSSPLEMHQGHDGQKASGMKAFCRRVKTDIAGNWTLKEILYKSAVGNLFYESSLFKFIKNIFHAIHFVIKNLSFRNFPAASA